MKQFYSVSEVAARFEVSSQAVRNWIAAGRLQSVQPVPGGRNRIRAGALLEFEEKSGLRSWNAPQTVGAGAREAMASYPAGERSASELERIVDAIVTSIQPDGVILFGSRARGDDRADSDFDLAILVPDGVARRSLAMRAYESLATVADRSVAVDIVVVTPSILQNARDRPGSIAGAVSRDGVFLYGTPSRVA